MAEQHPAIGRHVVGVVLENLGGRGIVVARLDDVHLDQPRVEPEPDHVGADRGDDEPHRVDRLPAEERDDRPRDRTDQRDDAENDLVACGDRRAVDDRYRRQILVRADIGDVAFRFPRVRSDGAVGEATVSPSSTVELLLVRRADPSTAQIGVGPNAGFRGHVPRSYSSRTVSMVSASAGLLSSR